MNWLISLKQFENLATSSPSPPYLLLAVGLFVAVVCVIPFVIVARQRVIFWSKSPDPQQLPISGGLEIMLPFFGTAAGICIFLAAGLEVLGLPVLLSLVVSFILTVLLSYFAWSQFGKLLGQRAVRSYLQKSADLPSRGDRAFNRRAG